MPAKIMLYVAALSLAVLGFMPANVVADEVWLGPSYDCTEAATMVEKAVCTDTELAALDLAMVQLYKDVIVANSDEADAIRGTQRLAMKARNACKGDPQNVRSCIEAVYVERVEYLMRQTGNVGALPKAGSYLPIFRPLQSGLEVTWVDEATVNVKATAIMGAKQGCEAVGNIAGARAAGGFGFLGSGGHTDMEMPVIRVVGDLLVVIGGPGYCTPGSHWPPVWVKAG